MQYTLTVSTRGGLGFWYLFGADGKLTGQLVYNSIDRFIDGLVCEKDIQTENFNVLISTTQIKDADRVIELREKTKIDGLPVYIYWDIDDNFYNADNLQLCVDRLKSLFKRAPSKIYIKVVD